VVVTHTKILHFNTCKLYNSHVNDLTEKAYTDGISAQKAKCEEQMRQLEADHEQYVKDTEKNAKDAADSLEKMRTDSAKKVADLNKELDKKQKELNKYVYGSDGKQIKCPELEAAGEIHLGSDFTTQWNKYNKELVK